VKPGLSREDVIWKQDEWVGLPRETKLEILTAQKLLRAAPKGHYERMVYYAQQQAVAANLAQLRAEAVPPVLVPPHDYVVELPRGVDLRQKGVGEINLGKNADGTETVAYDISFMDLVDGPFDGLSYSRYLYNGYEGQFVQALTNPGVPFYYAPAFYGGAPVIGGVGGFGGAAGVPGFGGFGGFPSVTGQIYRGSAADFAAGHPFVLNYLFNQPFAYRDPVQTAQLINTLNAMVGAQPVRRAVAPAPAPAPVPVPGK
jgi:hypothetical protein